MPPERARHRERLHRERRGPGDEDRQATRPATLTAFSADDFSVRLGRGLTFRYVVGHDDTVTVGPPISR